MGALGGAVGLLIPVHRSLRPWLDHRLFAEQATGMAGFETLLAELSRCENAGQLSKLAGEGLDALLEPDSIATYARAGGTLTPIFVHSHMAPAAISE